MDNWPTKLIGFADGRLLYRHRPRCELPPALDRDETKGECKNNLKKEDVRYLNHTSTARTTARVAPYDAVWPRWVAHGFALAGRCTPTCPRPHRPMSGHYGAAIKWAGIAIQLNQRREFRER